MSNPQRGLLICHPTGGIYVTSFFFRVASVVQPSASLPAPYAPLRGATPNPFGVRCNAYTFNARVAYTPIRVYACENLRFSQFWPFLMPFRPFFAAGFHHTPRRGPFGAMKTVQK